MTQSGALGLAVVSPVYGCSTTLPSLCQRLETVLSTISPEYEIILVNDGSPDGAWDVIVELARRNPRVKGINLSRNFGQHYAITAGLDFANADWVVVMDCDLQDLPEEIPKLYQKAHEGFDLVVGRRAERKDSFFKKLGSQLFYRVFSYLTESHVDHRIGNFGIYSRRVIQSVQRFREQNRSFGLFALWVGFRRAEIDILHASRPDGRSTYNLRNSFALAMDSIIAHSNKVLHLAVKLGLAMSLLSIAYATWIVARYFLWGTPVLGWTSLIVSVYFTAGLTIGTVGVVGLYVGKIFDQVKERPLYIVASTTFEVSRDASLPPA